MTQLDKNLSEIFDVTPISETTKPVETAPAVVAETPVTEITPVTPPKDAADADQADKDHETVRENMIELVSKGKVALDLALDVINQSDSPRAFEVFATLITAVSKANLDLNELHQKKQDLKNKRSESGEAPRTVNNTAIFVGSTAELNKMLSKMTKDPK